MASSQKMPRLLLTKPKVHSTLYFISIEYFYFSENVAD